ncbi:type 1 fimbrial protein [Serratia marcescens]|uniref:fimbrial protein n=1 Tax=Serratia marcescens TaxID=615 RepID=UPI00143E7A53|nr:fimbrial protein [Serratia marcescens]MBH2603323.1 type 1 fimbrial protein [Serratia marcescens]MBH2893055.1 type 1 fimbrial protein [Serratia marcescens]MBN5391175.1 type 1 fimbrial protein [Serratia marcescens]QIX78201.1 type 1 fimbrial protein [Serratia marcescens]HDT6551892.1 type 1 fimbrial protein [Serratia marcescens]
MMRKIALPLTLLGAAVLAPPLQAADGNINVTGRVLESACVVDAGSKNQILNLGTTTSHGGGKDFNIVLQDCPASISQVRVKFEGTAANPNGWDWEKSVFAANNSSEPGAAKGVGFLIYYFPETTHTSTRLAPNELSELFTLKTGTVNRLEFSTYAMMTDAYASAVEFGKAIADIQFSIVYP